MNLHDLAALLIAGAGPPPSHLVIGWRNWLELKTLGTSWRVSPLQRRKNPRRPL